MKKYLLVGCLIMAMMLAGCGDPHGEIPDTVPETEAPAGAETLRNESQSEETDETKEKENPSGIVTLSGTVVDEFFDEQPRNVLTVRVYINGERVNLYVKNIHDEELCPYDQVLFSYDSSEEWPILEGYPIITPLTLGVLQDEPVPEKPVIYLYPEVPTEVSVKLTLNGELTCTYPAYGEGWNGFTAHPDGTLYGPDGKEYYCLYWEGIQHAEYDFSTGFCVKGRDTAAFLEWALAEQGLTPREANEFIIYWLPRMEGNAYNVISFQTDAYTDGAALEITPKPDCLLRVFMAYYPSEEAVELAPQSFSPVERDGFVAVEWGGSPVGKP